jgi:predicted aspartyl protease
MGRHSWLVAIAALVLSPASAQTPDPVAAPPEAEPGDIHALSPEVRMTVPINIGERGPYRFIVDTGAERTVVSRELSEQLQLAPGVIATVISLTEVSRIPTAIVPALRLGRRTVNDIHAPVIAERQLGADGLLGLDSLIAQRLVLNFRTNEMTISPSRRREPTWDADTIVVTARSRFGRLVLVDAALDGQRIWVILDTGTQISIANEALRRQLQRRRRLGPTVPIQVISVTGGSRLVDYGVARRVRLGRAEIANLPIGFADLQVFRKLDLLDRPAMLLGMEALQLFDRVSLDFASGEVRLEMPPVRRPDIPVVVGFRSLDIGS